MKKNIYMHIGRVRCRNNSVVVMNCGEEEIKRTKAAIAS